MIRGVNRGPATRRAHKRCANPACRQFFRPERPTRRFCSRQCSADVRPRQVRVLAGRKGGTSSGIRRRAISSDRIRQRVATLTPMQAFLLGRQYGKADIGNRVTTAKREGFADGYEAAIQAMAPLEKTA
ncbi:MAG: hypothetical protein Q8T13_05055 [Acidobacteriota bacterium]|nr:hypothetical protein [Acidobacteriota bacterium]